jgi:hypothetical protein
MKKPKADQSMKEVLAKKEKKYDKHPGNPGCLSKIVSLY